MAVVTTKSTFITNRDAIPKVLSDPFIANGSATEAYGYVSANNGDSIASFYKLISLPSNARICGLRITNGALGTSCTVDVGIWYPTVIPLGGANFLSPSLAGTLINSTSIASAVAVATANTTSVDLISTATVTLDKQEMPLWQMIGLTSDPECNLDMGYVVRAAAVSSTALIAMRATFIF